MMNNVQLQGRVCFVNYKEAERDANGNETKSAFLSFSISYNTGRKEKPEDKYNREILVRCKCFGKKAEFIHKNFPEKSQILIDGLLDVGNDYTSKTGELVKGGLELLVKECHFCGPKENIEGGNTSTPAPIQKPVVPPAVPGKPTIPVGIKPIMPKTLGK